MSQLCHDAIKPSRKVVYTFCFVDHKLIVNAKPNPAHQIAHPVTNHPWGWAAFVLTKIIYQNNQVPCKPPEISSKNHRLYHHSYYQRYL